MAHFGNLAKSGGSLAPFIDEIARRQLAEIRKRGNGAIVEEDLANAVAETIDAIGAVLEGDRFELGFAKSAGGISPRARKARIADAQLAHASCQDPARRVALRQRYELARAG